MSLPPDQSYRDAIRNELDVTMLVEAAAGTGKTTNLVKRMVNLVATGRASVSSIAAITFTLKAAAHLREEFLSALAAAPHPASGHPLPALRGEGLQGELFASAAGSPSPRLRGEGARRADEGQQTPGFIGTTHAFCARLLRERPVEAGLDPEFEELDEAASRQITSEFWNRWFDAKAVSDDPLVAEARDVGLDRKTLRGAFVRIVEYPDVVFVSERRPRPNLRHAVDALVSFLDKIEPLLPTPDKPDEFLVMIRTLIRERGSSALTDIDDQIALLDDARRYKPTQNRWPDKQLAKQLGIEYLDIVENMIRPALRAWREHVHGIALELLRPAAAQFFEERRRNGTLTFQDLLVCARDLLRDHPNVRRYFQRRFTHVLVDEFQDTDPVQAEVLMYLTGEEVEERNWRKIHPRPGSLFIVGDPKQSIYRFRRADITTYLDVRKIIEESGGRIVPLSTNFRSVPAICTYVNEAFANLFTQADVDAGMQAKHVDLTSFVAEKSGGVYSLETPQAKNEDMACSEAEVVGNWIRRSVAAGSFKWSDVLLVSWQRPRLSCYARTFERLGIPYEITGSKAFNALSELDAAMPLLRAVVLPEDEVAVVAFLRGPLCGIDDDTLYRYRKAGGSFSPFAKTIAAEGGGATQIARGLQMIRDAIEDARKHPPGAAIARLFDRIGLIALAASGDQPGTRSGNLLLALSIARDLSSRGETLASIVEQLGELLENPPDIEELDVDPTRTNAVRLMNLHQVKGLEAPVVFLIDPSDEYEFPTDLFVDRSGDESLGHFAVTREWGKGRKDIGLPVGWADHETREKEFKRAEKMRLLYVAATRAKEMLVVGFRTSSGKVKGAWRELASRVRERLTIAAAEGGGPTLSCATLRAAIDIEQQFAVARAASYSVMPVTKVVHASHAELVKAEEGLGKGTSWGRVLHRLFEAMLRNEALDVRLYADNLLKDEERDPVELSEVLKVVDAVRGSALWARVKAADERYVEIPFALEVPRREVGLDEDGETLLHGTIDLVFREGGEWFIVDYKSDSTTNRLDALIAYYKPQVEHYARFWSRLTNAPARGGLFFVDGAIEHWVARSSEA